MRIIEFEARDLLKAQGLPVPPGEIATTPAEVAAIAQTLGRPVVIKAQIPIGGRMKAGGVCFANTPSQAENAAQTILQRTVRGFPVHQVLVAEKLPIADKAFVAVTYDSDARQTILIASRTGGIDIENTTAFVRRALSPLVPVPDFLGRELAGELGFSGQNLVRLGQIFTSVARCFFQWDATLLEINPLIMDPVGQWWVADVHLELDDDAAYRQSTLWEKVPRSRRWAEPQTEFERQARAIDSADHRGVAGRLIPFDGDLGLLIGGGGASLTVFDAVLDAGLKPANYCEIGGNPSVWKTKELTKLILRQPQVRYLAVIMNVVSNTRVDLVARGVIKGVLELGRHPQEAIVAFRVPGSWEDEGRAILQHYGIPFFGRETSIDQVVDMIKTKLATGN